MAQPNSPNRAEAVVVTHHYPWDCKEDEDDRRFAYRCMMQAHKLLKPSQLTLGVCGKR